MQISLIKGLKISILLLTLTAFFTFANAQQVIVSDDASYTTPASGAMLDVKSSNKGFLPPRISLTSTSDATTIPSRTEGLLIYNTATASDLTPGYYYWNGSKWERILNSSNDNIQTGIVTVTDTATLSKSDNFVYTTNDVLLTLPTVTAADNGLTIFIKNVGTYHDHVVIKPEASKTIDGLTEVHLTRFGSNTFIARDGNWVLRNQYSHNTFIVGENGSFATIAEAIDFMGTHMHEESIIELTSGTHNITSNIIVDLDFPVTIKGSSYGNSEILISSGITGLTFKSTGYIKMLNFTGLGSNAATVGVELFANTVEDFYEIKDSYFLNFNKGVNMTKNADLWLFEVDFEDCATSGVHIATGSTPARFRTSECDYINCANGINHVSGGTGSVVSISNSIFYNSTAGQKGINYVGGDFLFESFVVSNNSFNNVGTFATGFDFTLSRDANIFLENNPGVPTERPHAGVTAVNNTAITTITTNVFTKANFTSTSSNAHSKFAISGNRLTYMPIGKTDLIMNVSGNITGAANNMVISIAIVKNGVSSTLYGETKVRAQTGSQPYNFSTVVLIPLVTTNDYFEIFITSDGGNVTVTDLNWFAQSL